jgi:hypothetical protein
MLKNARARLQKPGSERILPDVKKKLTAEQWWEDLVEYERTHEIAFASPRALLEARMIEAVDKARRPHRRIHRNGVAHRRKALAG